MKISVIGAGYVGLTTAACLAQIGHEVFCSESDIEKLQKLQNGLMPLFEPHLENILSQARKAGRLTFGSTDDAIDWGKPSLFALAPLRSPMAMLICRRSKRWPARLRSERKVIVLSWRRAPCRCRPACNCESTLVRAQHNQTGL